MSKIDSTAITPYYTSANIDAGDPFDLADSLKARTIQLNLRIAVNRTNVYNNMRRQRTFSS